jgi:hypothetical protein
MFVSNRQQIFALSAIAVGAQTLFFHFWPVKHVGEWLICINVVKIAASVGLLSALAGRGWQRLVFIAIGSIELWMICLLGTVG